MQKLELSLTNMPVNSTERMCYFGETIIIIQNYSKVEVVGIVEIVV